MAGCDGRFHVIDLKDGNEVGSVELDSPTGCAPAVLGDTAFVGTEGSVFLAIDWRQAKVLWRYEDPEHGGPVPLFRGGHSEVVVVGAQDKLLHAHRSQERQAALDLSHARPGG